MPSIRLNKANRLNRSVLTFIDLPIGLALAVVMIAVLVGSLTLLELRHERERNSDRATVATQNLARLIEQSINSTFKRIDISLSASAAFYEKKIAKGQFDPQEMDAVLHELRALQPDLISLRVTDLHGNVLYGRDSTSEALINLADRDFFQRARDDPKADLIVSGPVMARMAKRWVLVLARRLEFPDHSFAGVVYANIATEDFSRILSSVEIGKHGAASLRMTDMRLIRRQPESKDAIGSAHVSQQLTDSLATQPLNGSYVAKTAIDGIERINAYRSIQPFPMYVIVGLATEDFQSDSNVNTMLVLALAFLTLGVTVFSTVQSYRYAKQLSDDIKARQRTEEELQAAKQQLTNAQTLAMLGNWIWDISSDTTKWSNETFAIFGISTDLAPPTYAQVENYFTPSCWVGLNAKVIECASTGTPYVCDCELVRPDGTHRWIVARGEAMRNPEGHIIGLHGTVQDITERKLLETQLTKTKDEQDKILDNKMVAVIKVRHRQAIWVNSAMSTIFGYAPEAILGKSTRLLYPTEESFINVGTECYGLLAAGGNFRKQIQMMHSDGQLIWIDLQGVMLSPESGESLWMLVDITPIKKIQEQVEHLAFHDALTGLPNRLLLTNRLPQALATAQRLKRTVAVCYLDLDGFKAVNDRFGHDAGDIVLKEVASRLRTVVRANDTVCRLGGDEFVLVLTNLEQAEEYQVVVQRAISSIDEPIDLGNGNTAKVSVSIGISRYPQDSEVPEVLITSADRAMYKMKSSNGHRNDVESLT